MKKIMLAIRDHIGVFLMTGGFLLLGGIAGEKSAQIEDLGLSLMTLGGMLVILYLIQAMHIVLHETGHLLGGLATGYQFVSFRVGSFMLLKDHKGKYHWKKFHLVGTGGQCLLAPPHTAAKECPYLLYHLSGGLMNLFLALLSFVLYIVCKPSNVIVDYTLLASIVFGITMGLTNLIPANIGGMPNDGMNAWKLGKDSITMEYMNLILEANAYMSGAASYEEIPESLRNKIKALDYKNLDLSNSIVANAVNFQLAFYQYENEREKCKEIEQRLIETEGVPLVFQNEARCEMLYQEILADCDADKIEEMCDKKLQKYVKTTMNYPSRQRQLYAYYRFCKKDEAAAAKCFEKLKSLRQTHPSNIEVEIEIQEVERLRQQEISEAEQ